MRRRGTGGCRRASRGCGRTWAPIVPQRRSGPGTLGRMPVDTPAWVRDAVFYQIFPGPVRGERAGPQARRARAVGRAADRQRLQGRRPARHRRAARLPRGPRDRRALPQPGLRVGLEPPLPHVRLPHGRSAARRRTTPCASCSTRPTAAGMRVVLDGVFNHTGRGFWPFHHILETGAASPYRGWFHFDEGALDAGPAHRSPTRRPGTPAQRASATRRGGGSPALPKLNIDEPGRPRVPDDGGRALAPVRHRRLARWTSPTEIDDEGFWQEFRTRCRAIRPDAYLVGEIWHVAPEWLAGDRFDALMNYPLAEAILGFAGGSHLDMGVVGGASRVPAPTSARSTAPGSRRGSSELLGAYDPDVVAVQLNLLGSHDTPRMRIDPRRRPRRRPPGDAPAGDAAGRAVHLLRRRGRADRWQRPRLPGRRSRGTSRRWDAGMPRLRPRRSCACARAEPALRDGPLRPWSRPRDGALAFERRLGDVAARGRGQRRRRAGAGSSSGSTASAAPGGASSRSTPVRPGSGTDRVARVDRLGRGRRSGSRSARAAGRCMRLA